MATKLEEWIFIPSPLPSFSLFFPFSPSGGGTENILRGIKWAAPLSFYACREIQKNSRDFFALRACLAHFAGYTAMPGCGVDVTGGAVELLFFRSGLKITDDPLFEPFANSTNIETN